MINKGLPYHTESEQSVLGAILLDPTFAIPHTLGVLNVDDFYIPAHKAIFSAMLKAHRSGLPVDIVLLSNALHDDPDIAEIGGMSYIGELLENTPTAANVKYYVGLLRSETERRNRILKATAEIQSAYFEKVSPAKGYVKLADIMQKVLEDTHLRTNAGRLDGPATGFEGLDNLLCGLNAGGLYIVAARPSIGKSALCSQIANNIFNLGGRVAFFPLEAGYKGQTRNLMTMATRTEGWKLKVGKGGYQSQEELDALMAYYELQTQGVFNLSLAKTPKAIESVLRQMVQEHGGIDIAFIDHLQEMGEKTNEKRHYQLENILQEIRFTARDFDIPIVLAAQINREGEGREPTIADIKDCGSIEQIADGIILLHSDGRGTGRRVANLAKHRGGATGKVNLWLQGEFLRFESRD